MAADSPASQENATNVWHAPGVLNVSKAAAPKHSVAEWQTMARTNAYGAQTFTPSDGFTDANRALMGQIYTYYGTLHTKLPTKFHWAGLAKLAGGAVVGGLDLARLADVFTALDKDLDSCTIVGVAQTVFEDIAWQFEAYAGAGIAELRALLPSYDAGNPAKNGSVYPCMPAWELIEQGGDQAVQGARLLLQHEQKVSVQNGFDSLTINELTGRARAITDCPHPYGRSFIVVERGGYIQNVNDRWHWVSTDLWPRWVAVDAGEQARLIGLDFSAIVARNFGPLVPAYLPPGDGGEDDD